MLDTQPLAGAAILFFIILFFSLSPRYYVMGPRHDK